MRVKLLLFGLLVVLVCYVAIHRNSQASWTPAPTVKASAVTTEVDFDTQVKPILEKDCKPCHFNGGVQYERMPFDRPETIKKLGTKLFTRIQDEQKRKPIREFLEQQK